MPSLSRHQLGERRRKGDEEEEEGIRRSPSFFATAGGLFDTDLGKQKVAGIGETRISNSAVTKPITPRGRWHFSLEIFAEPNSLQNCMENEVSNAANPTQLKFLSDKPTNRDSFGTHQAIANVLKDTVMSDLPKPCVIGLFGSWGSGKSSIVEMLRSATDRRFKMVVIDAWRKDRKNFLRQFIKKLARGLLPKAAAEDVCKRVDYRRSDQTVSWKPGKLATIAFVVYVALAVAVLWWTVWGYAQYPEYPVKETASFAFLILAAMAFQWYLPKYSQQIHVETEQITIEDPSWFRQIYFEEILGAATGVSVCIVVDNLDRLATEDSLAIIKTIKTFIVDADGDAIPPSKAKVTFLIPCDDTELISRLRKGGGIRNASEFLRKFVNVSLRIPKILDLDNTGYIRRLVEETGLSAAERQLENIAFVVSRASGNNPRKPKSLLNHFAARYNLAQHFADCRELVNNHPDWFLLHSVVESEVPHLHIPESVEPARMVGEHLGLGIGDSVLPAARPIMNEIPVYVWRTFQFLKKANVHDEIPHFNELLKCALDRDRSGFRKIFLKLILDHAMLPGLLWGVRQDNPSRMAIAECLFWAYEDDGGFNMAATILNDIAILIQSHVTGWLQLPPDSTYELVIQPREDCISATLTGFASNMYDGSEAASDFMCEVMSRVMTDCAGREQRGKEILQVLELRCKTNPRLTAVAIRHPAYKSQTVFVVALDNILDGDTNVTSEMLCQYIAKTLKQDAAMGAVHVQRVWSVLPSRFGQTQNASAAQRLHLLEFASAFLVAVASGEFQGIQRTDAEIAVLKMVCDRWVAGRQVSEWEEAYLVQACCIELSQVQNLPAFKNVAIAASDERIKYFLGNAPEPLVQRLLENYKSYFEGHGDKSLPVECTSRSAKLAKFVFRRFPSLRMHLLIKLSVAHPEWAFESLLAARVSGRERDDLALAIVQNLRSANHALFFKALGELRCAVPEYKASLTAHFGDRINRLPKQDIVQFTALFRDMDLAGYQPTDAQKDSLRKVRDLIPLEQLRQADRDLLSKFLAETHK
jgi:hypothetical protein